MHTSLRFLAAPAALVCSAIAQTPTASVGFLRYDFPATGTAAATYLSAPISPAVDFTGRVTGVGADTLSAVTAGWRADEYQYPAGYASRPAYVTLLSGAQAGRTLRVLSNTGSQLTLDTTDGTAQTVALTAPGFTVAVGDTFELCQAHTLQTAFGNDRDAFPGAGGTLAAAGGIGLYSSALRTFEYYYWHTGQARWVKDGNDGADAGRTVLPPNATLAILRPAGAGADTLLLAGRAPTVAPLLKHPGAGALRHYGMHVPVAVTLSQLSLGSAWTRGTSVFTADTLSIPDGTVVSNGVVTPKWTAYFQRPDGEWRKSGGTASQNATVIPAGTAVAFLKRAAASGSTSFLKLPLPYTP